MFVMLDMLGMLSWKVVENIYMGLEGECIANFVI